LLITKDIPPGIVNIVLPLMMIGGESHYLHSKIIMMIRLIPLKDRFTIYKLGPGTEIPDELLDPGFFSITSTNEEVSLITRGNPPIDHQASSHPWKGFRVAGILDLALTGILSDIAGPLKDGGISIFTVSTYNTDYIFVMEEDFRNAMELLDQSDNIQVVSE
jgi:hypothetical protein